MSEAKDYIDRLRVLQSNRRFYETDWNSVNKLTLIDSKSFDTGVNGTSKTLADSSILKNNRRVLYDTTAVYGLGRLSSALVSLLVPSGQKWHNLKDVSYFTEESEETAKWLERVNDLVFDIRYTPASGWDMSIPRVLKSVVGYGQGVLLVEEGKGATPIKYSMKSLSNCYLGVDDQGNYNTNYRTFVYTAQQAVEKFSEQGDSLPAKITTDAAKPESKDNKYEFMHVVEPRDPSGRTNHNTDDIDKSKFVNNYICVDEECTVRTGGYFEFPYVIFWWNRDNLDAYGDSPVILALAEIAGLNSMGKDELLMYQKQAAPPYLMSAKGKMRRLNTNPNAMNTGVEWQNGKPMFQSLADGQGYNFAEAVKASRQGQVEKLLFINLFQVLIDQNNQTATEAIIRSKEKAEMLAPIANSFRQSASHLLDVELGILERKGVFDGEFANFSFPESLDSDSDIQPRFDSPLDRARNLGQVQGIQQSYALAAQIQEVTQNPAVMDIFDPDKDMKTIIEIVGHPLNNTNTEKQIEAIRTDRAAAKKRREQIEMMQPVAKAAKDGADAMATMQGATGEANA